MQTRALKRLNLSSVGVHASALLAAGLDVDLYQMLITNWSGVHPALANLYSSPRGLCRLGPAQFPDLR